MGLLAFNLNDMESICNKTCVSQRQVTPMGYVQLLDGNVYYS